MALWSRRQAEAGEAERRALAHVLGTPCRYAAAPFALAGPSWLLAMPAPPPATDIEALLAWQPGDVVAIDLATGRASLPGEPGAWLMGDMPGDRLTVFCDGPAWARAFARTRAEALATFRRGRSPGLTFSDPPALGLPGLLVCGTPERVTSWAPLMGRQLVTFDNDSARQSAHRWLMRSSGLPALAPHKQMRSAA